LKGEVTLAEFSPDDKLFATASNDSYLSQHPAEIWNLQTGERLGKPLWHRDGVFDGKFSPDGIHFLTGSEDFTAAVWEAATGKSTLPNFQHNERVLTVSYSEDGAWIATGAADKTIRVWNSASGEPLIPWLRHNQNFQTIAVSTDSPKIIAMDALNHVWQWTLPRDNHRLEDLPLLAQLLASELDPEGQPGIAHIQKAWNKLKSKYPEDFTPHRTGKTAALSSARR
jgi:WD40 repeat protein